jgi:sugar transferase (PEP-CTERM/EpsH1 system associated)
MRSFADVDLVSLVHDDEEAGHIEDTRALATTVTGVRVPRVRSLVDAALALPTTKPLSHALLNGPDLQPAVERIVHEHPPNVVLAFCTGIAHVVMRPPLNGFPLVLEMVDVDSEKWAALARTSGPPLSWIYKREARWLAAFETAITRRAFATILTSDKERDTLLASVPDARIEVMHGVDASALRPNGSPAATENVVFCGVMNYAPNEEGAAWLAREVWPIVRKARPTARLELVGSSPTAQVRRLASDAENIFVTGQVPDVRPYLWGAAVAAAPLQTARGVQNKVLEAVAAGLPAVVTPLVLEGVPTEIRPACIVGGTPAAFAEALLTVLSQSPAQRRELSARADVAGTSWERQLAPLEDLLRQAVQRHN